MLHRERRRVRLRHRAQRHDARVEHAPQRRDLRVKGRVQLEALHAGRGEKRRRLAAE